MARTCITVKTQCGMKAAAIAQEAQECPMHDPVYSYYLYIHTSRTTIYLMLNLGHPDTNKDAVVGARRRVHSHEITVISPRRIMDLANRRQDKQTVTYTDIRNIRLPTNEIIIEDPKIILEDPNDHPSGCVCPRYPTRKCSRPPPMAPHGCRVGDAVRSQCL